VGVLVRKTLELLRDAPATPLAEFVRERTKDLERMLGSLDPFGGDDDFDFGGFGPYD